MIQDDFKIVLASKLIKYMGNGDAHKIRRLYSFVMDEFDRFDYVTYSTPMKAFTPNMFGIINGWTLDSECLLHLCDGIVIIEGNEILLPNSHFGWAERGIVELLRKNGVSAAASSAVLPTPIIFVEHNEKEYMLYVKESNVELMVPGQPSKKYDLHDPEIFDEILKAIIDGNHHQHRSGNENY